jgi:O-antigen ligase
MATRLSRPEAASLGAAAALAASQFPAGADADSVTAEQPKWDLLLVSVVGYILTAVGRIHQLFPVLELLHPAFLAGLFSILLYALDRDEARRVNRFLVPTSKLLVAFLGWMVLSVPLALRAGNSFDVVFANFAKTVVMYFVIAGSVRRFEDIERLVFAYFAAAVIYSAVILLQFEPRAGDWRLGRLYYYDANDFATFTVTAMPLGLYFLMTGRGLAHRTFAAIGLLLLMLGFVEAGSRGGLIALGVVVAFVLVRYTAIPLHWRLSVTALIAVMLIATASNRYWEEMGTIMSDKDYNRTHEYGRLQIWSRGIGYMLENPLLGLGPGNFQVAEGTLSDMSERQQFGIGVRWNAPHNSFVQVGAELGIPGLILFVAIIASALASLRRSAKNERALTDAGESRPHLTPALTAALLGFVFGSFFLSLAYAEMLYTLLALSIALEKVTGESTHELYA